MKLSKVNVEMAKISVKEAGLRPRQVILELESEFNMKRRYWVVHIVRTGIEMELNE